MTSAALAALESQIAALTPGEKAEVLCKLLPDAIHTWPGIDRTPEVSGRDACIVRTRISVWMLDNYRRLGWTEAKILDNYPTLRAVDLVQAWAYADAHREEIDAAIAAHEAV